MERWIIEVYKRERADKRKLEEFWKKAEEEMKEGEKGDAEGLEEVQKRDIDLMEGIKYFIDKNYDEAIKFLEEKMKRYARREEFLDWIGNCYYAKDMLQEAINTTARV